MTLLDDVPRDCKQKKKNKVIAASEHHHRSDLKTKTTTTKWSTLRAADSVKVPFISEAVRFTVSV